MTNPTARSLDPTRQRRVATADRMAAIAKRQPAPPQPDPDDPYVDEPRTSSGPACGHCSYGHGRDRHVVRHESAAAIRRCWSKGVERRAEAKAEKDAEARNERYFEERGAEYEAPDVRFMGLRS